MNRIPNLSACLLLALAMAVFPSVTCAARPNIIVMMADDMGMGDTSAYQDFTGNSDDDQLVTPNMERLARMGVRFTDAHTPSTRCTGTRYGLLTGRYPWRNRMKHWVLFGAQGDPMIEADRPTIATMLRDNGYSTAVVGKWHVGLRYRQSDGSPAAGWEDADLTQPLHTSPLDHGFDFARITSRSHGTSGPDAANPKPGPNKRGPGHIHGRDVVGAIGKKKLVKDGPHAYVLTELGGRHSDSAIGFLAGHVTDESTKEKPFFLYYPSNSNHGPHTPDTDINGEPVAGASRTRSGKPMGKRYDYIYENDVALGRLLDWLEETDDPRNEGQKLIENTLVIFTSDNGAEIKAKTATGPFRSNKGSVYEGGHRVPFIVTWKAGEVGDGNAATPGKANVSLIGLQDLFATFAEILEVPLPDLRLGQRGAEDSRSVLAAFRGAERKYARKAMLFNDHNEAAGDKAACAIRMDLNPNNDEADPLTGQWKLFFDAELIRFGKATPTELYDLAADPKEKHNLIANTDFAPSLVEMLTEAALLARNTGGHNLASLAPKETFVFDWRADVDGSYSLSLPHSVRISRAFHGKPVKQTEVAANAPDRKLKMIVSARGAEVFRCDQNGLGLSSSGRNDNGSQVDSGESLLIKFDRDVLIESVAFAAGDGGQCGGFYRMGNRAPLAIYCVDADNDAKDQHGVLSDLGVLRAGETLILNSAPHLGVENPGVWQLQTLKVRSF